MRFLIHLFASALTVFIAGKILPGIQINGFIYAFLVALVIGLLNATLGFLLKIITFPINFLTLGLMSFLINVLMIRIADNLMVDFNTSGFLAQCLLAIFIAIINPILQSLFGKGKE